MISYRTFKTFKTSKKTRSKSGYYMFSSNTDIRNKIKNDFPEQSKNIGFVSKQISELWNNLSEEDKNIYKQQAIELNEKLKLETVDNIETKKIPKKTAYNCFIGNKALREEIKNSSQENLSMIQINKILSDKWKNMSDDDKNIYKKQANDFNDKINKDNENKTEENKTEENKTEENKTEENKTEKKILKIPIQILKKSKKLRKNL